MKSTLGKRNPRKPISEQNKPGRYDPRNQLNDLTGKEWLLLTNSFWVTEPTVLDKSAYAHPAPFMVKDIEKLISFFTKKGMTVLDPFVGCGTTLVAANRLNRKAIGIDINKKFMKASISRLSALNLTNFKYIIGDAKIKLDEIGSVDYIVTSPPYHNILRNDSKGLRYYKAKPFRMGAREGVAYYTNLPNDLGNFQKYADFISAFKKIMAKCFSKLKRGKYCTIIISDFTVDTREICVQADIVRMMNDIGFIFCGTTVLLQPVKPLFPFGYPFAYKINHHHHNMITFQKPKTTKPKNPKKIKKVI